MRRPAASASIAAAIALGWALLLPAVASAELSGLWALDDGTKVKADAVDHALRAGNGVYDGKSIKIFGVRNETVAFQLILVGGKASTGAVSVTLPQIGTIKNGAVSNAPDSYFLGRNIELFQQRYHNVTQRSQGLAWEGPVSWAEVPKGFEGPVPDALVPLNIVNDQVAVPANRNQGIWIDVYIPKGTPAGVHKGTLEVSVGGQGCGLASGCQLPVELEVLDATLPDEAPVKTMLYFSCDDADSCLGRYLANPGSDDPKPIQRRHYKLFRRHLVTGIIGSDSAPSDEVRARLDGSAFSAQAGYYGWGEGKGQDVYSVDTYGHTKISHDKAVQWNDWLAQNATQADYFAYVWDEPGSSTFSKVNTRAADVDPLPALVTVHYTSALDEVDIFCTYAESFDEATWKAGQTAGKRMWIYNGTRPFSGSYAIDDTAVSLRANPWIQYKYNIERWFYWEATYYNDFQGTGGPVDVFNDPMNFTGGGNQVNGDGLLVYPGRDRIFPKSDLGFDHPLPSIRLKNWRRGIQDIAYLKLIRSSHKAEHDAALKAMVPKVLDQTTWNTKVSWPDGGEPWLTKRRELAALLKSGSGEHTAPAPDPSAPSPAPPPSPSSSDPTAPDPTGASDPALPHQSGDRTGAPASGGSASGPAGVSAIAGEPGSPDGQSLQGGCAVGGVGAPGPGLALGADLLLLGLLGWRRRSA